MIQLRRLTEVPVTGAFALKCETPEQFKFLQSFFITFDDYVKFKDLPEIGKHRAGIGYPINFDANESRVKFFIKYESLNELLKLREVFNARGNKFDLYLIKKRGYNILLPDFFDKCADPKIYKVIT